MKDKLFELNTKYALLLAIFYGIVFGFSRAINSFEFLNEIGDAQTRLLAPYAFSFVFNLITAYIVGQDIKKYDVKTKYVTLATIVFRPIGVVAFLLFLFLQDKRATNGQGLE